MFLLHFHSVGSELELSVKVTVLSALMPTEAALLVKEEIISSPDVNQALPRPSVCLDGNI